MTDRGQQGARRTRESAPHVGDENYCAPGGLTTTTGLLVPTRRLFILLRISSAITWASTGSRIMVGRMNRISSVRARVTF